MAGAVSNLDAHPTEQDCRAKGDPGPVVEFYEARDVPLGGVRGVHVLRALPQRVLPTVGAWCFLDHFGPDTTPMNVNPHPHIGLQTVTWPFQGDVRHRDSVGSDVVVRPRQLNIMTAGRGIAHSEIGVEASQTGHGLQLWTALPEEHRDTAPHFEQHQKLPVYELPGLRALVFLGTLDTVTSPATAYSPIVGADITINPGATATIPLTHYHEHAVLVIDGDLTVADTDLPPGPLLYLGTGRSGLTLTSHAGAHLILLGGEPFREDIVMWWNFVGRSHEDIEEARDDWEKRDVERFPDIAGHTVEERIPAPPLPGIRLKPRGRGPR
ncbi:Pirin domain protein [Catenulispora acidiphila DSM 44928]|uniref:Pirin domain protein n=1 Tax=Catenulispora acidiphila (strain DSM 44928 / JCM 14897 / NBRC 102108 / NRRL B-24433 / ID139908) TaxID=479433 RepID=C7QBI9_CATAD|nr:Pirin domain protein [Catenulispora acidiphila DSM 44928]